VGGWVLGWEQGSYTYPGRVWGWKVKVTVLGRRSRQNSKVATLGCRQKEECNAWKWCDDHQNCRDERGSLIPYHGCQLKKEALTPSGLPSNMSEFQRRKMPRQHTTGFMARTPPPPFPSWGGLYPCGCRFGYWGGGGGKEVRGQCILVLLSVGGHRDGMRGGSYYILPTKAVRFWVMMGEAEQSGSRTESDLHPPPLSPFLSQCGPPKSTIQVDSAT